MKVPMPPMPVRKRKKPKPPAVCMNAPMNPGTDTSTIPITKAFFLLGKFQIYFQPVGIGTLEMPYLIFDFVS